MKNKMKELIGNKMFITGVAIFSFMIIISITAPLISPYNPWQMQFTPFEDISISHPLGINNGGQDILSELLYSIQNSIYFGIITAFTSLFLGVFIGTSSAIVGGIYDLIIMRLADIILSIPLIMILILIAVTLKPSITSLALILGLLSWPAVSRSIRAQTLSIKESLHIKAALNMGASYYYIITRHIIPELYPLFVIAIVAKMRMAILIEATIAFLGLIAADRKSLGIMINYSLKFYYMDVWTNWILPPVISLSLLILSITFIAISLEGMFNPGLKKLFRNNEI